MYTLPPPPKSDSARVQDAIERDKRNHIHEVVALFACGFVGAALIVFFIAKIIALAGDKFNF